MKKERIRIELKLFTGSKKAQFYLIAAAIIIAVLITLTSTTNLVTTKNNQDKVELDINKLNYEAIKLVDYSLYNNLNGADTTAKINNLGSLFSDYIASSGSEQLGLYIFYGDTSTTTPGISSLKGQAYVQRSSGSVQIDNMEISQTNVVVKNAEYSEKFKIDTKDYINITIKDVTYTTPLSNNNFMIVLTTSDGFNNYIATNNGDSRGTKK
jgi:hypothetical protein